MKIDRQSERVFKLGKEGFGFFDAGASRLKLFNWKMGVLADFEIKKGEGPGEIKRNIREVILFKNNLFIRPSGENKLVCFDKNGKLISIYPLPFSTGAVRLIDNKLRIVHSKFYDLSKVETPFWAVLDPQTGHVEKTIAPKANLTDHPCFKNHKNLSGFLISFDISESGDCFILVTEKSLAFKVNAQGELQKVYQLPLEYKGKVEAKQVGNNTLVNMSLYDFYDDLFACGSNLYLCFRKTEKYEPEKGVVEFSTTVEKMNADGATGFQKKIGGALKIMGVYENTLYCFDFDTYAVMPIKL